MFKSILVVISSVSPNASVTFSISFKLCKYVWYGIFSFNAVLNSSILSVKKFSSGIKSHCKADFNSSTILLGIAFIVSHKLLSHSHKVLKKLPIPSIIALGKLVIPSHISVNKSPIVEKNELKPLIIVSPMSCARLPILLAISIILFQILLSQPELSVSVSPPSLSVSVPLSPVPELLSSVFPVSPPVSPVLPPVELLEKNLENLLQ